MSDPDDDVSEYPTEAQPVSQTDPTVEDRPRIAWSLAALALLGGALLWSYVTTMREMAHRWQVDPRYSHGYLVPLFSIYLLWSRRAMLARPARASWSGVLLLALGAGLRLAGVYTYVMYLDALSLLVSAAGLAALLGGKSTLRWAWPSIAFLAFMLPLPYRIEMALGGPLQRLATMLSTFTIQVLGLDALAEGNVIYMDEVTIGVVEACSGLGMLYTFLAITTAMAIVIRRPLMDKMLIVASAIPIAVAANVARIVITGVLSELVGGEAAHVVFHDLAGWLMMPVALALLLAEVFLLSRLFVEDGPAPEVAPALALQALSARRPS